MQKTDVAKVYETLLTIPGMNETVKVDLRMSRKNVLLLSRVLERGLAMKDGEAGDGILAITPKESLLELASISEELLEKAGLTQMNQKLQTL